MQRKVLVKDISRLLKKKNKKWKCPVFRYNKMTCIEILDETQENSIIKYLQKEGISVYRENPVHLPKVYSCYASINLIV